MTLTLINENSSPAYIALRSDIVGNKIAGANQVGKTILLTDSGSWKIINPDLTLSDYVFAPSGAIQNGSTASAFGTPETAELEGVVQLDFVYGLNIQTSTSGSTNGGSVDTNEGRLRLQTGTSASGTAYYQSKRVIKYRPGQGITARFTPLFTTGVPNSRQIWGCGDNGQNGYFFGYNGSALSILHRNSGSSTWTSQSDWNGVPVSWDATKGSPVMIKYPYLGYGNIMFYIQNRLAHSIQYANTTSAVQLSNPNMYFYGEVVNTGNTTNLISYAGSVGIFLSGKRSYVGSPMWSMVNTKSSVTTETNIITFKNATSYNGMTNHSVMRLTGVSLSSSAASGLTTYRFRLNSSLGGSPSYTTINGTTANGGATITSGNSAVSYDVAGTTVTGGLMLSSYVYDNPDGKEIDLMDKNITLSPGDTLTISATSSATSEIGVALKWVEDI